MSAIDYLKRIEIPTSGRATSGLASNAHIHIPPNFSAFTNWQQAVELADEAGLGFLGVNNYYDFTIYADFAKGALDRGILPLFSTEIIAINQDLKGQGIRINDPGNPGRMYICGKGLTQFEDLAPGAEAVLEKIRTSDQKRMELMADKMNSWFEGKGIDLNLRTSLLFGQLADRAGCSPDQVYLQERHLAQGCQEALFAVLPAEGKVKRTGELLGVEIAADADDTTIQGHIRSVLMKSGKPCYVPEEFVNFDEARTLIEQMDGIVVYPVLADGAKPVCEFEGSVEDLAGHLKKLGIRMAEFIPNRNDVDLLRKYVHGLRKAGLAVSAGTEHNTPDMVPMRPECKAGVTVPADIAEVFMEGTYVILAHQWLTARGKTGFVGGDINILELASLGQTIAAQFERSKNREATV